MRSTRWRRRAAAVVAGCVVAQGLTDYKDHLRPEVRFLRAPIVDVAALVQRLTPPGGLVVAQHSQFALLADRRVRYSQYTSSKEAVIRDLLYRPDVACVVMDPPNAFHPALSEADVRDVWAALRERFSHVETLGAFQVFASKTLRSPVAHGD